jgi:hypothetical protein
VIPQLLLALIAMLLNIKTLIQAIGLNFIQAAMKYLVCMVFLRITQIIQK